MIFGTRYVPDTDADIYTKKHASAKFREEMQKNLYINRDYEIISKTNPVAFSKNNPVQAREALEGQLLLFVPKIESPIIFAARARDRISTDEFVPWHKKLFS